MYQGFLPFKNKLEPPTMPEMLRDLVFVSILVMLTVMLRLPHLGYSDYIGDEHKAFMELSQGQTVWQFFMEQRKGPMQFLVSYIPYYFTGDWHNELMQRLPFTVFGVLSVLVFYAFVKKATAHKDNSAWIAFLSAFLLSVNGFVIGFSRIAQYQNLNLFFSFLALYFYYDFFEPSEQPLRNTLFGTVAFSLSLLSHWDAIFILPPIIYWVVNFAQSPAMLKKDKAKILIANFILGCLILLPFLVPYVWNQVTNPASVEYFERRVEFGHLNFERYKFLIQLYNPFFVLEFLLAAGALAALFIKKTWKPFAWFAINYLIFEIFVRKPGTHIYNFIVPFIIFGSMGIVFAINKLPELLKPFLISVVVISMAFFAYQSHLIFIDSKIEYPWKQEVIADFWCPEEEEKNVLGQLTKCGKIKERYTTPKYSLEDKAPLFGFPLRRFWDQHNNFVNMQNLLRNEDYKYITNEVKTISEWYMDAGYGGVEDPDEGFYVIGVKRPLSFVEDWKMTTIGGKEQVYEIEKNGEVVVRVYRVDPK